MHGAQHRLLLAVVAHCLPGLVHRPGERRRSHADAGPEAVEQLLGGRDPVAVLDQVDEEIEDPGLDRDPPAFALQGPGLGVEPAMAEGDPHRVAPSPWESLPERRKARQGNPEESVRNP